jgi:hypothetical protein
MARTLRQSSVRQLIDRLFLLHGYQVIREVILDLFMHVFVIDFFKSLTRLLFFFHSLRVVFLLSESTKHKVINLILLFYVRIVAWRWIFA